MKKADIQELGFIAGTVARVEVERVEVKNIQCRGWHSKIENKEMVIYTDRLQKSEIIGKIATAISKKSRRTRKDIVEFLKSIKD